MTKDDKKIREDGIPEEETVKEAEPEKNREEKEKLKASDESETGEEDKEEVSEEDEDVKEKYLRLMADFQNYKRRSEKERKDIHAYANEGIISNLLEVLDNFERALDHEADEGFKEGMVMIFQQFKNVLKKSGVEEIKAENAEFDPNFHHAVVMEESSEVKSGFITVVLQKGYMLNDKVIRPSMVKVAK